MLYCLSDELSRNKFKSRVEYLLEHAVLVELTDATRRSTAQNSYLHVVLGAFALHVGEPLQYVKQEIYKRMVNKSLYVREKDNPALGHIVYLRSSTELTKDEMSLSIDRFRKFAAEFGCYTPAPGDFEMISRINAEMSNCKYL